MAKRYFLDRLIQWLRDIETRRSRGCHLCVHIGEPQTAHSIHDHPDTLIISPCLACDREHDCFQLDYEKLAEAAELGLITKGEVKHVYEQYRSQN